MADLLILAPLAIEARALRRGLRARDSSGEPGTGEVMVMRTGMGPDAAQRATKHLERATSDPRIVVAGFCGGLQPGIRTGDVIVASEVRGPDGAVQLPGAGRLAETLRSAGLAVHLGPMLSSTGLAFGGRRRRMAAAGSLAVDMESYWLLRDFPGDVAVIRAVSDAAGLRLLGGMLPFGWLRAYRSLQRVAAALAVA